VVGGGGGGAGSKRTTYGRAVKVKIIREYEPTSEDFNNDYRRVGAGWRELIEQTVHR
jgi:hypothetical protein